jgi:hypothetical protein
MAFPLTHDTGNPLGPIRSTVPESQEEALLSPTEIVAQLGRDDLTREDRRRLVIEAEACAFSSENLRTVLPLLRRFIERFRDSSDADDMVAVGSALRKFVMNMPIEDLDTLAVWFDPGPTTPVSWEIELELAKTVLWRVSSSPPDKDDAWPALAHRLKDRADAYLRPWLLLRENHAAVAQDATLGLLLMRSHHVPSLLNLLVDLHVDWFTELLVRRGRWIRMELENRFPPDVAARYARNIAELEQSLQMQSA